MSTERPLAMNRSVYLPLAVNLRPLTLPMPAEKAPVVTPVIAPPLAGGVTRTTVIGPVKFDTMAPVTSVAVREKFIAALAGTKVEDTMLSVRAVTVTGLDTMFGSPAAETL